MPIYEYRCKSCQHELEKLQKISDPPLVDCPQCGQPELTKLISAAAFRLKGGGWYETDFKKDKKRNLADDGKSGSKEGTGEGAKSGDGSGKKSESKSTGESSNENSKKKSSGEAA